MTDKHERATTGRNTRETERARAFKLNFYYRLVRLLDALQVRANRAVVLTQLRLVLQRVVASHPV